MKITYITFENMSLYKGSVVHIKEMIVGLRELGHHVTLIAPAFAEIESANSFYNIYPNAIKILKFLGLKRKSYFISSISLFLYLFKVLPQCDIIYARECYAVLVALLPRLLFNRKLVFEINGLASEEQRLRGSRFGNRILVWFVGEIEKLATRCSERIVSVTPQIAAYLARHYGCQTTKTFVIGNGVNTNRFYPMNDDALLMRLRKRLGIKQHDNIVMFVGNLAAWQGIEYLIKAAPLLVREIRNIRFVIIGNGMLKRKFEEDVNKLGLRELFIFTGMIPYAEIPHYINVANVCVALKQRLISGYSPLKLYEYMACGKPVVATDTFGFEILREEEAGILVDPDDCVELMKAIKFLIYERDSAREMGHRGAMLVRERFGWDRAVRRVEEVLNNVLKGGKQNSSHQDMSGLREKPKQN